MHIHQTYIYTYMNERTARSHRDDCPPNGVRNGFEWVVCRPHHVEFSIVHCMYVCLLVCMYVCMHAYIHIGGEFCRMSSSSV